jgi:hypothetical protein
MNYWRSARFWLLVGALLLPSAILFALPGALFMDEETWERRSAVILPCQAFLTVAIPFLLAKRIVCNRVEQPHGFPVVSDRGQEERKEERTS